MKELSQSHLFLVQERETQEGEVTCQGHSHRGTQDKSDTDTRSKIKIYDDKRGGNHAKHPESTWLGTLPRGGLNKKTLKTCREHRARPALTQ